MTTTTAVMPAGERPHLVVSGSVIWLSAGPGQSVAGAGGVERSVISLSVIWSSGCQRAGRAGRFLARGWA